MDIQIDLVNYEFEHQYNIVAFNDLLFYYFHFTLFTFKVNT